MFADSLGLLGLFTSAFISSTLAPGGSEAVLAYMINQAPPSVPILVLVATVGNTLGALTTWGLGFWTAKKYPAHHLLTSRQQKSLHTVRHWGSLALLFSWLPIVGDGLCFAGGWLKLSLLPSLIAIIIGKAFRYAAIAYFII